MKRSNLLVGFLCLVFLAGCSQATEISIQDGWARPGNLGGKSAVYFTVRNPTRSEDAILSASSDVAQVIELHTTMMDSGGMMQMQPLGQISVPPGDLTLEPGGIHIMLIGLQRDLRPGDTFEMAFQLKTQDELKVTIEVRTP
jgi:hypothetical protein